jgi:Xaa-Pro aminopeptidase
LVAGPRGPKRWLHFETLTLVPFERALIDAEALDRAERAWIDAYHARILVEVAPGLDGATADWIRAACAPL